MRFIKIYILVSCLLSTFAMAGNELVYCENTKSHGDWEYLGNTTIDGEYIKKADYVSQRVMRSYYTFLIPEYAYHQLVELCKSTYGRYWVPHPGGRWDNWHLFSTSPISTSGARGLAQGRVFNKAGQLVASTTQEGLLRQLG